MYVYTTFTTYGINQSMVIATNNSSKAALPFGFDIGMDELVCQEWLQTVYVSFLQQYTLLRN